MSSKITYKYVDRLRKRETHSISSSKKVHVPANGPSRGPMLHNKGDSNGL